MGLSPAGLCATGWYCPCPRRVQPHPGVRAARTNGATGPACARRSGGGSSPSGRVSPRSAPLRPRPLGHRPAGEGALGTRKEPGDPRAPYLLDPLQSHPRPAAGDQAAAGPGRPEAARCRLRRRAAPLGERPPARARRGALWAASGGRREGAREVSSERAALARGPVRLPAPRPPPPPPGGRVAALSPR